MDRWSLDDLEREHNVFDALVAQSPELDRFCSSTAWVLPAHHALMPPREPWIWRGTHGVLALARGEDPRVGRYAQPLEAAWGLASGFASPEPRRFSDEVASHLVRHSDRWDLLLLCGLREGGEVFRGLVRRLSGMCRMGLGEPTRRYVASLEGGVDGFMGRRTSKFRANLRRSMRRAQEQGVTFAHEAAFPTRDDQEAIYARIQAVEARSWKGMAGVGVEDGPMRAFYRRMVRRLGRSGALRVVFAQRDGEDIAYVFGGVFAGEYRGLQLSFDDRFRKLSLGNLVQSVMIEHLADERVRSYDLGSELPYKARWAEQVVETQTLYLAS